MDMGSYALADKVKGFSVSYNVHRGFFHLDFDVGPKQRVMWIPAAELIKIGALPDNWTGKGKQNTKSMNEKADIADPLVVHLKAEATTNDGALLLPTFHNGRGIGLEFTALAWRQFVTAVRI